jgi:outer membrane protein OmpA-like peptidoglycan-associated protein/opacity protein-like surface antigen
MGKLGLLALAAIATSATAAERSGFYIGGDVGQSNWNVSQSEADAFSQGIADALSPGFGSITADKGKLSDTDMTYSLFVGYQFVPWLAVEAAYMDLGNENIKATGSFTYAVVPPILPPPPTGGTYRGDLKFESTGWAASLLPMLPIGDSWNLYGRLGYYMGDNKASGSFSVQDTRAGAPVGSPRQAKISESDDSGSFLWGVGASYTWNQRVSMRLEYDNIVDVAEVGTDKTDVERFTLGLVYRFGDVEEAMPVAAVAAPVAAVAAAPTKCADADNDGVCDTADRCANTPAGDRVGPRGCSCDVTIRTHFAFDSAELTAEDKAELDRVATRLTELEFVGGTATGHTDNVGDEAYNQKLSERRAQAVVDYLAAKGVASGRVTAIGMGETKPLADNATEEGRAENRRVTIRRTDCGPAN